MASTNIQGRSVDSVSSENATISLGGGQDGSQGFFLLDHNLGTVKAVLFLVRDQPFKLQINSSGPRGFMAWLEMADNEGQGTEITSRIVNIAHNFDPSRLDVAGNVLLDRWNDSDRALVPVSRDKVRFNDRVSPDLRKILTLKIAPLTDFEAGGIRWSSDRPRCDAQRFGELAALMLSPEVQVNFNLKKGSLPVRGDVDLAAANDCMKKGLEILAAGNVIQSPDQLMSADSLNQINDLFVEFFNNPSLTPEAAQERFVSLVASAD